MFMAEKLVRLLATTPSEAGQQQSMPDSHLHPHLHTHSHHESQPARNDAQHVQANADDPRLQDEDTLSPTTGAIQGGEMPLDTTTAMVPGVDPRRGEPVRVSATPTPKRKALPETDESRREAVEDGERRGRR